MINFLSGIKLDIVENMPAFLSWGNIGQGFKIDVSELAAPAIKQHVKIPA